MCNNRTRWMGYYKSQWHLLITMCMRHRLASEGWFLGAKEGSWPLVTSLWNSQSHLLTGFMVWATVKIEQKGKGLMLGLGRGTMSGPRKWRFTLQHIILWSNQGRITNATNVFNDHKIQPFFTSSVLIASSAWATEGSEWITCQQRGWAASKAANNPLGPGG